MANSKGVVINIFDTRIGESWLNFRKELKNGMTEEDWNDDFLRNVVMEKELKKNNAHPAWHGYSTLVFDTTDDLTLFVLKYA